MLLYNLIIERLQQEESESEASQQAKQKGWRSIGFGRWVDNTGNVVADTVNGKLVPRPANKQHSYKSSQTSSKPERNKAALGSTGQTSHQRMKGLTPGHKVSSGGDREEKDDYATWKVATKALDDLAASGVIPQEWNDTSATDWTDIEAHNVSPGLYLKAALVNTLRDPSTAEQNFIELQNYGVDVPEKTFDFMLDYVAKRNQRATQRQSRQVLRKQGLLGTAVPKSTPIDSSPEGREDRINLDVLVTKAGGKSRALSVLQKQLDWALQNNNHEKSASIQRLITAFHKRYDTANKTPRKLDVAHVTLEGVSDFSNALMSFPGSPYSRFGLSTNFGIIPNAARAELVKWLKLVRAFSQKFGPSSKWHPQAVAACEKYGEKVGVALGKSLPGDSASNPGLTPHSPTMGNHTE